MGKKAKNKVTDCRQHGHTNQILPVIPGVVIAFCRKEEYDRRGQPAYAVQNDLRRCLCLTVFFDPHPGQMIYGHGNDSNGLQCGSAKRNSFFQ